MLQETDLTGYYASVNETFATTIKESRLKCLSGLVFPVLQADGNYTENWCDDNNFYPYLQREGSVDWFNQYLSCFYWSLTMLMKTPFVGPDTVLEKVSPHLTPTSSRSRPWQ